MNLTPAERDLLSSLLQLEANQRGQVFDELLDSLTGHDELDALMDEPGTEPTDDRDAQ